MITILGSGAFGTALAISLSKNSRVTLWTHNAQHAIDMIRMRENTRRLDGISLPENITITADLDSIEPIHPCLLTVPTQKLRGLLEKHGEALGNRPLVACCKGIELSTGIGPTAIIADLVPTAIPAILTGPSFARDIASGLPTALTLACAQKAVGKALQQSLTTPNLRIYRTTDTIGAELGGALKNVIAIGCGAVMGAGLGESARAALMTRGFAEMNRMAIALGAQPDTLSGLSGFGDLTLTCTSNQSRNYRFGQSLGRNDPFDPSITVEGVATAHAVEARALTLDIEMPVTQAVTALIDGKLRVDQAVDMLLSRPLKEE
ncbi:Glycerol-3-phosphate dehydrogenase [NAD(P)+] [Roseovarius litorisediminis]|uniref:Glycerol-3-phosphate dehydrogenase [NAD(P)+] n=1 Tax=Roseovarius litorisediminis TaxID=1312363 RepID=A0A1Y5SMD0_9RHOB|nr:NAD(P)H-dependent glycerol-3-phosphate dehydrogenase [Roseovarius litorisediminis]SLN44094.1 Glycerol-3-phosphate dehydrogenase [NAD(P)+] [Roseovarius litorisediminis]